MATSFAYRSVFANESTNSTGGSISAPLSSTSASAAPTPTAATIGLASVISHVAHLETTLLRGDVTAFFASLSSDTVKRTRIGNGASFIVERAELKPGGGPTLNSQEPSAALREHSIVAIKTVKEDPRNPNHWRDVLFEIRALLHEPVRYHPNIVRLLDIGWDSSTETGSRFPTLIQEFAEFGTLDNLQKTRPPLPFSVKQKLCYDIGRGLSILHACGIAHGDLKHENVLIFANKYTRPENQPFTAKLADFGGTVMDMDGDVPYAVPMFSFPYEAPEVGTRLSADGVKKTDAFSYGTLVWRCMVDGQDILPLLEYEVAGGRPTEEEREGLCRQKRADQFLAAAVTSITTHSSTRSLPQVSLGLVALVLLLTLRGDPSHRDLVRAQACMRGMTGQEALHYANVLEQANRQKAQNQAALTPGRHGLNLDGTGYALGRMGDDYDAQNNLPGYRPDLPHPGRGGFLFDPLRLRGLLDWSQQEAMLRELQQAADGVIANNDKHELQPWSAAYFLYQCYLGCFGTAFDAEKACYWLRRAANPAVESAGVDYLAKAWLTRVHSALGVANPLTADEQIEGLFWSAFRGHRHCLEDSRPIIEASSDKAQTDAWQQKMGIAEWNYKSRTGATGMPHFISRKLTRKWDTTDLDLLDQAIREELGNDYDSCLRQNSAANLMATVESEDAAKKEHRFDKIYVNHRGHGLLHIAAALGHLHVLKHVLKKYACDINLKNQSHSEAPLTSACKSGNLDCAVFLLENGADPNGSEFVEEAPLHCISNLDESETYNIASRLVGAGADLEKRTNASRKDIRGILADWEDNSSKALTPLGRAVLMQNLPAVRILLELGAAPVTGPTAEGKPTISPVDLAAVLTLPNILEELLKYAYRDKDTAEKLLSPYEMLKCARSGEITPNDSLSLQSRLVRCGIHYKAWLARTLRILQRQASAVLTAPETETFDSAQLCEEISLGNVDVVEALLDLGHPVNGDRAHRPIQAAVRANNEEIFQLLAAKGSSLTFEEDEGSDKPSLLHLLASRPRNTPRSTTIAQHLLAHGVPAESTKTDSPSPLVLAIKNRYFELADLLLSNGAGASLNVMYLTRTDRAPSSILGSLLKRQTFSALESVAYLASLHNSKSLPLKIDAIVSGSGFSAVYTLALNFTDNEWNNHSQISARIVQHVLEMFPNPPELGDPIYDRYLGTPLSAAVHAGNLAIVRALLDSKYRIELDQPRPGPQSTADMIASDSLSPDRLSISVVENKLTAWEREPSVPISAIDEIKRHIRITELLVSEGQDRARAARLIWDSAHAYERLERMEGRVRSTHDLPAGLDSEVAKLPVDLSVLSEEKPVNWVEGTEMNQAQAMRVFLNYFRRSGGSFVETVNTSMDQMFNKRTPEAQSSP